MQKLLTCLLLSTSGCVQAASLMPEEMPDGLKQNLMYALSMKSEADIIKKVEFRIPCGDTESVHMGENHPVKGHIVYNIDSNPYMGGNNFTLSFDLLNLESKPGGTLVSLYIPDAGQENGLFIQVTEKNHVILCCNGYADSNTFAESDLIYIGRLGEVKGKTLTIVYDGDNNRISAYLDGNPRKPDIQLTFSRGLKPMHPLNHICIADNYGGWHRVISMEFDNFYFWNKALSKEEVKSCIKNLATATRKNRKK